MHAQKRGRLYIEGHHIRKGYVVSEEYHGVVKYYDSHDIRRIKRIVERFNRIHRRTYMTDAKMIQGEGNA